MPPPDRRRPFLIIGSAVAALAMIVAGVVLLVSDDGDDVVATAGRSPADTRATTSSTTVATPVTTPAPTTTSPGGTGAATTATEPSADAFVRGLAGIGDARQVVTVVAAGYGTTSATLTAYELGPGGWTTVFGPWPAVLGSGGLAAPGAKSEGDNRTPSGAFGFDFAFGIKADPGVKLPWRTVTGPNIVWDDDSASPHYNEWVDRTVTDPGVDPEPMYNAPAYDYGAVIAYNTAERSPGKGSAIFLHVQTGGATAGCVAIPSDRLVQVLRWLDPNQRPRIVIGTETTVRQ